MRSTPLLGSLTLALAAAGPLAAGPAPDVRYVRQDTAEVRCLPSDKQPSYVTNVLHRGDAVEVRGEREGGWLAIKPPPGSYSWINTRFVESITPNHTTLVVVHEGADVPVLVGSPWVEGRPKVEGTRLPRGYQVRGIGPIQAGPGDDGTWMPIAPPDKEVRYIRADSVSRTRPGPPPVAARPGAGYVTSGHSAQAPADGNALLQQAVDADSRGQIEDAVRLYNQAGTALQNTDPRVSQQAFNRADWLRQPHGGDGSPAAAAQTYTTVGRLAPVPAGPSARQDVRLGAPCGATPTRASGARGLHQYAGRNLYWTDPGRLRRAGRCFEDRRTYALEIQPGIPLLYVSPHTGIDLEPYVDRKNVQVQLIGPAIWHTDLRANYMLVTHVQPVR